MPRVKAMTTGSIPSFLDAILNFAESDTTSTLAHQDTWLAQIRAGLDGANTGKLIMYGDDTWLKLFPDMFVRADGTSSFFVSVSNRCCYSPFCVFDVASCVEQIELNTVIVRTIPKWIKM
jgi:predicted AlkP superfamily pyrophosphatase or phosphodiesterase